METNIQVKDGEMAVYQSLYNVTPECRKWVHLTIASTMKLSTPIISKLWKEEAEKLVEQPSKVEEGYQLINQ